MTKYKEIKITLVKTKDGVQLSNDTLKSIDLFDDSDDGRKKLIQSLIDQFLNAEVLGGRKYI